MNSKSILLAALLLLPGLAHAQQARPAYGPPITLDDARKVIAAAEAEARKNNFTMVITVFDSNANIVAMVRMDGTQYGSVKISEGKARTAVEFKRPTKEIEDGIAAGGIGLRFLGTDVTPIEGGELLMSGGKIVGSIGASGGTATQDGQVARAGVAAIK